MSFVAGSEGQQSEMNVTPLIDVLLVLIIIFMVIQPSASAGLDTRQPQGRASAPAGLGPVVVEVLGDAASGTAQLRVDRRPVAEAELPATLRGLLATRQERTVFVQADRGESFRRVAEVVAAARQAGAATISLQKAAEAGSGF